MASKWPPRTSGASRTNRYTPERDFSVCPVQRHISGICGTRPNGAEPRLARLITRRSQVQILPPLLRKTPENRVFSGVSSCSGVVRIEARGHNAVTSAVIAP